MYAVIITGGKQYRVVPGQTLRVERLGALDGEQVIMDRVLLVADGEDVRVGTPYLPAGRVTATVKGHGRNDKVSTIKMRRRKHYRKRMGHRQHYTLLEINSIQSE
jgi:large subunit ribosomal protein L21